MSVTIISLPKVIVLQVHLICAQQLPTTRKSHIKTYVRSFIDPNEKLTSRIDVLGNNNPTWNDTFMFAIDNKTYSPNSTIVFEIYRVRKFTRDKLIGTGHVLLDSLMDKARGRLGETNANCVSFYVRGKSLGPKGILNIGVSCLKFVPSFLGKKSAVDYRKLMGHEVDKENKVPQAKASAVVPVLVLKA